MTNKQVAQSLRDLAQRAEQVEAIGCGMFFTCNQVEFELGDEVREQYVALFGLEHHGLGRDSENTLALWNDPACGSIRVLLLCFAAALAETGDLA